MSTYPVNYINLVGCLESECVVIFDMFWFLIAIMKMN